MQSQTPDHNRQVITREALILPGILGGADAASIATNIANHPERSKAYNDSLVTTLGGSALLTTLNLKDMLGESKPVFALVSYGDERGEESFGYMVAHGPDTGTRVDPSNYGHFGLPKPNDLLKTRKKEAQKAHDSDTEKSSTIAVKKALEPPTGSLEWVANSMNLLKSFALNMIASGSETDVRFVKSIVCDGKIGRKSIPETMGRTNATSAYEKKGQLLAIYRNDARLAETIVGRNIVGFHGSNSASLMGVLRHGLLSGAELRSRGHAIGSGERSHRQIGGDPVIRFADWRAPETIKHYSSLGAGSEQPITVESLQADASRLRQAALDNERFYGADDNPFVYNLQQAADDHEKLATFIRDNPDSLEVELIQANFPVAYGLSAKGYRVFGTANQLPISNNKQKIIVARVQSDVRGEFAVMNPSVPIDDLPVIAVPHSQIARVRWLADRFAPNTLVVDLESLVGNPFIESNMALL